MKKKLLSVVMALSMMLTLLPSAAIAAPAAADAPTISWTQKAVSDGVYKLVGHVDAPVGIQEISTALNFDNTVIQPCNRLDKTPFDYVNNDTNQSATKMENTFLVQIYLDNYPYDCTAETFVSGNRSSLEFTLRDTSESGQPSSSDYLEFYFRLKDGKTLDDLNANTFRFESLKSGTPAFSMKSTAKPPQVWAHAPAGAALPTGARPLPAENITLTYDNSTVTRVGTYDIALRPSKTDLNIGDTFTADVVITPKDASPAPLGAFDFTLAYDSAVLQLQQLAGVASFESANSSANSLIYTPTAGSGVALDPAGTTVARATFKVTAASATTATLGFQGKPNIGSIVDQISGAHTVTDAELAIHNIKITLKAGTYGLLNGNSNDVTLYAKYNEAGLWTDSARTAKASAPALDAAEGYRIGDAAGNQWVDGSDAPAKDFAAIAATAHTADTVYTLCTLKQGYTISSTLDRSAINFISGVTRDAITHKTAISFELTPEKGALVQSVRYAVGGKEAPLTAENGVYTIPAEAVTGNVALTVTTRDYVTITFRLSEGVYALSGSTTAYAWKDTADLFSRIEGNQLTGNFTAPTFTAEDGYRIRDNSSEAEAQWIDGAGTKYYGDMLGKTAFTKDETLIAQAIAQHRITVKVVGEGGLIGGKTSVTKPFDHGHVLQDSDFAITAQTGYQPAAHTWAPVTADRTYEISFVPQTYAVTWPAGFATDVKTATYGTDLTFTPYLADKLVTGVTYQIGAETKPAQKNSDGTYTILGTAITGDLKISFTTVNAAWELVSSEKYAALKSGTQVAILKAAAPAAGQAYVLSGYGTLFYSEKYQGYVTIVGANETAQTLAGKLSTAEGAAIVLSYSGDINRDGSVNSIDALPINAVLHNVANLNYTVTVQMRLEMDINGDKTVSTLDIETIIQSYFAAQTK